MFGFLCFLCGLCESSTPCQVCRVGWLSGLCRLGLGCCGDCVGQAWQGFAGLGCCHIVVNGGGVSGGCRESVGWCLAGCGTVPPMDPLSPDEVARLKAQIEEHFVVDASRDDWVMAFWFAERASQASERTLEDDMAKVAADMDFAAWERELSNE